VQRTDLERRITELGVSGRATQTEGHTRNLPFKGMDHYRKKKGVLKPERKKHFPGEIKSRLLSPFSGIRRKMKKSKGTRSGPQRESLQREEGDGRMEAKRQRSKIIKKKKTASPRWSFGIGIGQSIGKRVRVRDPGVRQSTGEKGGERGTKCKAADRKIEAMQKVRTREEGAY